MDELVELVRLALTAEYPGAPNGRVRDVPDRRAIRWYATTGLVDRPAAMRGRTALYGRRHLLQLVALKRRQADGRTLAEIQAELAGATDATLAGIAQVPDELLVDDGPPDGTAEAVRARFWAATPAAGAPTAAPATAGAAGAHAPVAPGPVAPAAVAPAAAAPATAAPAPAAPAPAAPAPAAPATAAPAAATVHAPAARAPAPVDPVWPAPLSMTFAGEAAAPVHHAQAVPLSGVALGGGAVLLLPGRPADDDYAAITTAAAPLVDLLAARGLISPTDADTSVKPGSGPLAHHDGSSR